MHFSTELNKLVLGGFDHLAILCIHLEPSHIHGTQFSLFYTLVVNWWVVSNSPFFNASVGTF